MVRNGEDLVMVGCVTSRTAESDEQVGSRFSTNSTNAPPSSPVRRTFKAVADGVRIVPTRFPTKTGVFWAFLKRSPVHSPTVYWKAKNPVTF